MKIVFVINNIDFLLSHRLEVCLRCIELGYNVHVIAPYKSNKIKILQNYNIRYHELNFKRKTNNIIFELYTIYRLFRLIYVIKPDILHLITIKPYLYGGIVSKILNVKNVVTSIAGLGIVYSSDKITYKILKFLLKPFLKYALSNKSQSIIFQNKSDYKLLINMGIIRSQNIIFTKGSGVDLNKYEYFNENNCKPLKVIFASRLLKDKGVEIFIKAAEEFFLSDIDIEFWLVGEPDEGNKNSITLNQIKNWEKKKIVKWFKFSNEINVLFKNSNIIVYPSYYGEGLPKVLIEAASCGRAIITTNHPGCRDAIINNKTGLLVSVRNTIKLVQCIEFLAKNDNIRNKMGYEGRKLAEKYFSVNKVVREHINLYKKILEK